MLNVTPQRSDILHLLRRIPQQQGAIAHRRIGGGLENSSFNTDQPVVVTVERGRLVIGGSDGKNNDPGAKTGIVIS
ncbi:hypothetical protein [Pectobacterium versatile]|uniref:hypothetical protein n=1 Tax=Pectobacterium versatile TaxID=2488639 RepID=UPI00196950E8|nr:hypothetical protein [Pectobacterium versatile]MBN3235863.1 hypothetical protein [Pectobacterium versatile]